MEHRSVVVAVAGALFVCASGGAQLLGPTPYLSAADSPFAGLEFDYFHLEDFEDGVANTPGLYYKGMFVSGPGPLTDSVDGDDGAIDGLGRLGHSARSTGFLIPMIFDFSPSELGHYPTHVGFAWTDVGNVAEGSFGFGDLEISVLVHHGPTQVLGPFPMGDGSAGGGTGEDRFIGFTDPRGISSVWVSMTNSYDYEIDHLQYGYAPVPGPGVAWLLAVAGVSAARRRR